jgi:hypothetical protein
VRFRSDGQLEFVGRSDDQLKVKGFRVEPGEIEAVMRRCDQVRDAIVVPAAEGRAGLIGYFVPSNSVEKTDIPAIRARLQRELPNYMVPDPLVPIDSVPLTLGGKVNRAALPKPVPIETVIQSDEPQGETEEAIAEMWSKLLGVKHVGRHDDFFAIGGHSLLAMQMVGRLTETFGVKPAIGELFARLTIAAVAEAVLNALLGEYAEEDVKHISRQLEKDE